MENTAEIRKIEIEKETLNDLNTTRKWTMFLAILGFILIGIIVIGGLVTGLFLSVFKTQNSNIGITESLLFVVFIVIAVIGFFPYFFLFRFSKHTSSAVKNLDKQELHIAFKNLKTYYVYIGILMIILISIYVIAVITAGTSLFFLKDFGTTV